MLKIVFHAASPRHVRTLFRRTCCEAVDVHS